MSITQLSAISPIDGRYGKQTQKLSAYFSEYALMKYRLRVEIEYFIALCELPLPELQQFPVEKYEMLHALIANFSMQDAIEIKEIEKKTNHDVKALEYFIKNKFDDLKLSSYKEFIHFGLTSQDINNTAIPLSLKEFIQENYLPVLMELRATLKRLALEWKEISMLARTHGQAASPTRMGKEIMVFVERLENQMNLLNNVKYSAKLGGATGNFNAHAVSYPEVDWIKFADQFVNETLGLCRSRFTTQIEHYDDMAVLFDCCKRINTILVDLCRDAWSYISLHYFKQIISVNEIGSSAMPHKVNPIDFENAEGNLGIANSLFEHMSAKLPVSRLQRDLTDSTVLRNAGVPFAHTIISFNSILKGLSKLMLDKDAIDSDLENNWAVVAEGIQTILRKEGYPNPYEELKKLTRINKGITRESLHLFIDDLKVNEDVKRKLKSITPYNYTGILPY
jgi:adenylosuccinate lyase